jgi:hypothetical protein
MALSKQQEARSKKQEARSKQHFTACILDSIKT